MNRDRFEGRLREIVGALEQGWGRVIGDQTLEFHGERARWLGRMQVGYGVLQDRTVMNARRGAAN